MHRSQQLKWQEPLSRNLIRNDSQKLDLPWVRRKKTPNPWNLVLEKFCASKMEEDINCLEEARNNFLEDNAKEFGLLHYPFGDTSSRLYGFHYKEKLLQNQHLFILYCPYCYSARCPFQIRHKLTPSEIRIWEKGEHNHSRDHRKTIPVAAAKQIKATMKLAPVGQHNSKLHRELIQYPLTRMSLTDSKVHAIQRLVLTTNMNKIIEMHWTTHTTQFNRFILLAFFFTTFNLQAFLVKSVDGSPIFRASAIAQ